MPVLPSGPIQQSGHSSPQQTVQCGNPEEEMHRYLVSTSTDGIAYTNSLASHMPDGPSLRGVSSRMQSLGSFPQAAAAR